MYSFRAAVRRPLVCFVACALGAGPLGCSSVLGIEDTTLGAGGQGGGGEGGVGPGEDYSCLGDPGSAPDQLMETITVTTSDATQPGTPLAGVTVKVCAKFDTLCTGGAGGPLAVVTGADGKAEVPVPTVGEGFDGFLEISAPGYKTVLWLFPKPVVRSFTLPVLVIDDATFGGFAGSLGVTPDPAAGHITLDLRDCTETPAPGVTFSATNLGAGSKEFYNLGGAFVPKDASNRTDSSGQAVIFNVPAPGSVSVTTQNAAGTTVAQLGMTVRPDTISTVILSPNQ